MIPVKYFIGVSSRDGYEVDLEKSSALPFSPPIGYQVDFGDGQYERIEKAAIKPDGSLFISLRESVFEKRKTAKLNVERLQKLGFVVTKTIKDIDAYLRDESND